MRASKLTLSVAALGLGTALVSAGAVAQDTSTTRKDTAAPAASSTSQPANMGTAPTEAPKYRTGASPNDNGMVNVQAQNQQQAQAPTPTARSNKSDKSNKEAARSSTAPQTASMGAAPTEAPKYRTGASPNDNGMVNVQAQNEAQTQQPNPGNRSGGSVGGGYYNYSPDYNSSWSDQSFGAPMQAASQSNTAACQTRFRSFDPASGTYMGRDGIRHACP